MYQHVRGGFAQDDGKAVDLWTKAADQKHAHAQWVPARVGELLRFFCVELKIPGDRWS